MGFYKNLDRKKLENDRYCKYCGGCFLEYLKIISYGNNKKEFSYKIICKQCKRNYFVKRTAYVYDQVKNKPWHKTESFRKKELFLKTIK
jgi:hypothetical protein